MKKLIILSIIGAIAGPGIAFAGTIVPGVDVTNCTPQSVARSPGYVPVLRADGMGPVASSITCRQEEDQLKRLYDLEVAVQALQARNAQLEANNGATGVVSTSLEARVSALENITRAIQDSLVMVVNMLAQALSSLKH